MPKEPKEFLSQQKNQLIQLSNEDLSNSIVEKYENGASNQNLSNISTNTMTDISNEPDTNLDLPRNSTLWMNIPEVYREQIVNNVWCSKCKKITTMKKYSYDRFKDGLLLKGLCGICSGSVERII